MKVCLGDLTKQNCDAIVNAANGCGIMGAGIAGAIKRAAGQSIEREAKEACHILRNAGEAYHTISHNLYKTSGVLYVIHAVTMTYPGTSYSDRQDYGLSMVRAATKNSLSLAKLLEVKTIAFPALGTGVGKLDINKVAKAMVDILIEEEELDITICDMNDKFILEVSNYVKQVKR